ncbi:MAG: hypothetical protein L6Q47_11740 [Ignavibacteriaceae bacterium]|nr:hypothetical protein [Ignavibacteriaceae bacterium]
MLINLTNHPFDKWDEKQKNEALRVYGTVADLPFPAVNPEWGEEEITHLSNDYIQQCMTLLHGCTDTHKAVHVMGEYTFTHAVVAGLMTAGVACVASTSERIVREEEPGKKTIIFRFVRFRKYN